MRRTFGWVVIGLLVLAGLVGCSDGEDAAQATTSSSVPEASTGSTESARGQDPGSYAGETCTALGEWADALAPFQGAGVEAGAQLQATAPDIDATQDAFDALAAATAQATEATGDLVDDLASIEPPDIEDGEETHQTLVTAFSDLARSLSALQPMLEVDVAGAGQAALDEVTVELERFGSQLTSNEAFASIDEPPAELEAAFASNEGCLEVQAAVAEVPQVAPEQASGAEEPSSEGTSTATAPAASGGGPPGDPGGGAGAVEDFCNAVQDYVAAVQADPDDPGLAAQAQELDEMASGLGTSGLTAADAERIAECSRQMADALSG